MSNPDTTCAIDGGGCTGCVIAKGVATFGRFALGALFIFSGYMKINDPQAFAFAIKGFKLVENHELISQATFSIPWTEVLIGVLVMLGLFTKAASGAMFAMLAVFTVAVGTVIARDIDTTCGCFGKFLGSEIDGSTVIRNTVLLLLTGLVFIHNGGFATIDAVRARRNTPLPDQPE